MSARLLARVWLECRMQVITGMPVHAQVLKGWLGGGTCVACPFSVSACKRQYVSVQMLDLCGSVSLKGV